MIGIGMDQAKIGVIRAGESEPEGKNDRGRARWAKGGGGEREEKSDGGSDVTE